MEGMVTDLQLAREKQQAFESWQRSNSKSSPIELSVTVLTTGFWPAFKVPRITQPPALSGARALPQLCARQLYKLPSPYA